MMNPSDFPHLSQASFEVDARAGIIHSPVLDGFLWLTQGVTTRQFAAAECEPFDLMAEVQRRLLPAASSIACCEQVHGSVVEVIPRSQDWRDSDHVRTQGRVMQFLGADGLIVRDPLQPIAIRTADCVPLLIVDVRRRCVAAVHAGWRGSLEKISERAVRAMARLGSDPADMVVWMGPAISGEAYEVGPELSDRFRAAFPAYEGIVVDTRLDLVLLNACQLHDAGVPAPQIHAAHCCTARRPDVCCSYRAEGERAGRMVTFAMILEKSRDNG